MKNKTNYILERLKESNELSKSSSIHVIFTSSITLLSYLSSLVLTVYLDFERNPISMIIAQQAIIGCFGSFISLNYSKNKNINTKKQSNYDKFIYFELALYICLYIIKPSIALGIASARLAIYMMILICEGISEQMWKINYILAIGSFLEVYINIFVGIQGLSLLIASILSILILEYKYNLRSIRLINLSSLLPKSVNNLILIITLSFSIIAAINVLLPLIVGLGPVYSQLFILIDRGFFVLQRILQSSITFEGAAINLKSRSIKLILTNLIIHLCFTPLIFYAYYALSNKNINLSIVMAITMIVCALSRLEYTYNQYIFNNNRLEIIKSKIFNLSFSNSIIKFIILIIIFAVFLFYSLLIFEANTNIYISGILASIFWINCYLISFYACDCTYMILNLRLESKQQ